MKTFLQNQVKVLNFDDIVFEGRNHEYGAYELRKKYDKRLFLSFFFTASIFLFAVVTTFIYNNHKGSAGNIDHTVTATVLPPPKIDQPIILPPPLPPTSVVSLATWRPTLDSLEVQPDIMTTDDLIGMAKNQPYDTARIIVSTATTGSDAPEPVFINVSEPATFQGGDLNNFRKWVSENLKYTSDITELQLQGKIIIQFVVNKNGMISDVKMLRGIDPLIDNESMRVINTSPKWEPGKQNGKPVRQQFVIPIQFKIQNQ